MTPCLIVRETYPKAQVVQVGVKKLYEIVNEGKVLGKGQSKKAAWKSAYRNIS